MDAPPEIDTMAKTASGEPGAPNDEALMEALQRGDEHALAGLMARWETGVKAFLLRLGVPPSDVEDVAQETFVRIFEKRAAYRAGAAFKPWLLTIAGNMGRNRRRWRWRRREESFEALPDAGANAGLEAGRAAADGNMDAGRDTGALVRAAVDALPDKLRRAVVCVELEDLSYNEAAQVMGCTPKAVETRLYRARELLRQRLSGIFTEEE